MRELRYLLLSVRRWKLVPHGLEVEVERATRLFVDVLHRRRPGGLLDDVAVVSNPAVLDGL